MNPIKKYYLEWKLVHRYKTPIYQFYLYIKDRIWAWWKSGDLKRAKKLAIARHKTDGKTYYVLPDENGRPRAFSSYEINLMKRAGMMNKRATCVDLFRESMFIANAKSAK